MFIQIEDCLCDFLTYDLCKKSRLKLHYYECENIERLVCKECYSLYYRTIVAKNGRTMRDIMKKKKFLKIK
jgi:hypothetical protein